MKLAIASEEDFRLFWSIHRAKERLEYARTELEEERCKRIILGRLYQLGGGFTRVFMGCQVLIDNCCDKSLDHYDFSPKIKKALELLEKSESETKEEHF